MNYLRALREYFSDLPLRKVAYGFCYVFLVMTSYYILKPVRESFFLEEKGYSKLPFVHLMVLAATFFAVIVYTRATRKLGPARLVTAANLFFVASVLGFWVFLTQVDVSSGWQAALRGKMAWVYYCWVSVFSVFAMTLFWSVIHTIFTAVDGSKCYGIIGSGATIGAIFGGWITKSLAESIGTENLLLVAAGFLVPCLLLGRQLVRFVPTALEQGAEASTERAPNKKRSALQIFRGSPYLCVMALIVMMTVLITVFDEYRYNQLISLEFEGRGDERTAFFGEIYQTANIIGLFFSLVLTGIVQSIWGPRPGMLLFALLVIVSAIAFLISPTIDCVFYSIVALQSVGYSIYQWSRELLYTQTSKEAKFIAKGFIDTFMFRAGAGGAALALILASQMFPSRGEQGLLSNAAVEISYVTIPLGVVLAGLAWWVTGRFYERKRQSAIAISSR